LFNKYVKLLVTKIIIHNSSTITRKSNKNTKNNTKVLKNSRILKLWMILNGKRGNLQRLLILCC